MGKCHKENMPTYMSTNTGDILKVKIKTTYL